MTFEIIIQNFVNLKNIFAVLNNLNDNATLTFTEHAIEIQQQDKMNVRVITIRIPKEEALKYTITTPEKINISTAEWSKLFNNLTKGLLKIKKQEDNYITITNELPNKIVSHNLKLFADDEEEKAIKIPKHLVFDAEIITDAEEFLANLNDLIFSESSFEIETTAKGYKLFDEKPKNNLTLNSFMKCECSTKLKEGIEKVTSKYNKQLLLDLLIPLSKLAIRFKIQYSNDYPLLISNDANIKISLFMAPLVKND